MNSFEFGSQFDNSSLLSLVFEVSLFILFLFETDEIDLLIDVFVFNFIFSNRPTVDLVVEHSELEL